MAGSYSPPNPSLKSKKCTITVKDSSGNYGDWIKMKTGTRIFSTSSSPSQCCYWETPYTADSTIKESDYVSFFLWRWLNINEDVYVKTGDWELNNLLQFSTTRIFGFKTKGTWRYTTYFDWSVYKISSLGTSSKTDYASNPKVGFDLTNSKIRVELDSSYPCDDGGSFNLNFAFYCYGY